jgi:hypothetical protein
MANANASMTVDLPLPFSPTKKSTRLRIFSVSNVRIASIENG